MAAGFRQPAEHAEPEPVAVVCDMPKLAELLDKFLVVAAAGSGPLEVATDGVGRGAGEACEQVLDLVERLVEGVGVELGELVQDRGESPVPSFVAELTRGSPR